MDEAEETSEYTSAVDIWSLGCVASAVRWLLAQSPNVKALNKRGRTPLHVAGDSDDGDFVDVVQKLRIAGADPDALARSKNNRAVLSLLSNIGSLTSDDSKTLVIRERRARLIDSPAQTQFVEAQPTRPVVSTELPSSWEKRSTPEGREYFVDHNTRTSIWFDPRRQVVPQMSSANSAAPPNLSRASTTLQAGAKRICVTGI